MRYESGVWRSSFNLANDGNNVITVHQSMLTILSGSTGDGGHVSMFLEMLDPTPPNDPKTRLMDLSAAGRHSITISNKGAQIINGENSVINLCLPKDGDPIELSNTHHHTYIISAVQTQAVIDAVDRFRQKVANHRYQYLPRGGINARLRTRPGTRGVNCADFVIKILREAQIADIKYQMFSTPFRVAS